MSGSDEERKTTNGQTPEEGAADRTGGERAPAEGVAAAEGLETALARIDELEAEIEKLRDQALRAHAEVENVLRRTEREKKDIAAYGIAAFARDLLTVADNLRRALEAVPEEVRADARLRTFVEGVEMTERELLAAFERHGIRKIVPEGEKFDHNLHQAMAEVETEERPAGTVVDVYQAGYVLKDRLLRPAMVTVAKNGSTEAAPQRVDTEA
ncbi:MAG: nucleotide exchange factor GrpE [Alphaproteobacteria bacterium]|nr:MAG: nucleotide exchange factor GrpE [Alphaproteobacteria bacterium]